MTDARQPADADESAGASLPDLPRSLDLPHELPPVQPPSAGMIVQLFLVPAVIVAAIIGVYSLFGRVASQELDWRQLTTDVRSENPHVRWRGALGLAQMLDADAQRGEKSQDLASRPEIAEALADLYRQLIGQSNLNEEGLKQVEFLSKALGRLKVPQTIAPVLESGMEPTRNHDVRKHSLIGLAMMIGTLGPQNTLQDDPKLISRLIEISRESDPLFRHQAAFNLGLLPSPAAIEQLQVLLGDPDQMVQVNAAIGLARNDRTEGLVIFHELFRESLRWKLNPGEVKTQEEESAYFERMLMLLNSVKAISRLAPKLSLQERTTFIRELNEMVSSTRDAVLKTDALELIQKLEHPPETGSSPG